MSNKYFAKHVSITTQYNLILTMRNTRAIGPEPPGCPIRKREQARVQQSFERLQHMDTILTW